MTTPLPAVPSPLARWGWPVGIAVVLAAGVIFDVTLMLIAKSDAAFAVEPDYYNKAVAWDSRMAQERANATLGWRTTGALVLASPGTPGRLTVDLRDRAGAAVPGATVSAEAMHNARASQRYAVQLQDLGDGLYATPIDAHRPGEWEVRIAAERGSVKFTQVLRITAR